MINTEVIDAEILVDEEVVGTTPLENPLELSAGSHTVRVRRPGYTEFTEVVEIRRGRESSLDADMLALSFALTVQSTPEGARVFINEDYRGDTPLEVELLDGDYQLRLTAPGFHEVTREITARSGGNDTYNLTLEELPPDVPEWYEDPLLWVGIGAGVLVAAAAVIVGVVLYNDSLTGGGDEFCNQSASGCDLILSF